MAENGEKKTVSFSKKPSGTRSGGLFSRELSGQTAPVETKSKARRLLEGAGRGAADFFRFQLPKAGVTVALAGSEKISRTDRKKGLFETAKELSTQMLPGQDQSTKGITSFILDKTGAKRALREKVEPNLQRTIGSFNDRIAESQEKIGLSGDRFKRFGYGVGSGASSLVSAVGITYLTKNPTAAAVTLGLVEGSDTYNQAKIKLKEDHPDWSDDKINDRAFDLMAVNTAGIAALEKVGLDNLFRTFQGGKLFNIATKTVLEALQESTQTVYSNLVARFGFDDEQAIFEGVSDAFLQTLPVGFFGGGFISVVQRDKIAEDLAQELDIPVNDAKTIVDTAKKTMTRQADSLNREVQSNPEVFTEEAASAIEPQDVQKQISRAEIESTKEVKDGSLTQEAQKFDTAEEFVESQGVQRIEEKGVDVSFDKPQGLYTTPANAESPHLDLGGKKTIFGIKPNAKEVVIDTSKLSFEKRGIDQAATNLVWLRQSLPEVANNIRGKSFSELKQVFQKEFPETDWVRYTEIQDMIEGYAGLKARQQGIDVIRGVDKSDPAFSEVVILNKDVILSKSQLTDIFNKAKQAPTQALGDFRQPIATEGAIKKSRNFQRVKDSLQIETENDPTYNQANLNNDTAKAIKFVDSNPEMAKKVIFGFEQVPEGITLTAIDHAYSEYLRENGQFQEQAEVERAHSFRLTRFGQEIVAERGRLNDTSTEFFMKQVIAGRLTNISKKGKIDKKTAAKGYDVITKKAVDLKNQVTKDTNKIQDAQALIDMLTC